MVELVGQGVYLVRGKHLVEVDHNLTADDINRQLSRDGVSVTAEQLAQAKSGTMASKILLQHNRSGNEAQLKIRFDALASHDITYVGIVQTARASGLKQFPVPYVLTNCHNSLCAVGGTINEDDHVFGLSAAERYGGIFVPAHQAVIHQYMREMMAGCGRMILGSDSHTRYGALGTMAVGEGGPEIAKQLLERTYDIAYPEVVAVYLSGAPATGVGPQDVALAIIKAVFANGFVKNKVMEFVGPGINGLSVDFRNGIDVMTTETTCLSSIWCTDAKVAEYFAIHGRPEAYQKLEPAEVSYYDGLIKVDLSAIEPMIALPFHPSNVYSIRELNQNALEILRAVEAEGRKQLDNPEMEFNLTHKVHQGRLRFDQGVIAGCAGGLFENIMEAAAILEQGNIGTGEFGLSVYPASQPVNLAIIKNGAVEKLLTAGATLRSAFCGPCFGAGDVPANGGISARHTTRNFPNREGSKPANAQIASVALLDARSIAATALHGGVLTSAAEVNIPVADVTYHFDRQVYDNRVYNGFGKPQPGQALKFGPNITDWPKLIPLPENLLLQVAAVIHDPVTTTDELIPSGETSSYRSNPLKLAEFTLGRKDPGYVGRAKDFQSLEVERQRLLAEGTPNEPRSTELGRVFLPLFDEEESTPEKVHETIQDTGLGTVIFARKPGDGSAREQAASCQRVLGGCANIAIEYATKRYRSNLINWGMLPFIIQEEYLLDFAVGDLIYIPLIKEAVESGVSEVQAYLINDEGKLPFRLWLPNLAPEDREIILAGCLMNYYGQNLRD